MHAGNILCALIAYLSAKSKGGKFVIRIEDLDKARCPSESAHKMLCELSYLGLISDEPPVWQSERTKAYKAAEDVISRKARVYPCFCSRAELHAATAPRLGDGGVVYGGKCRNLSKSEILSLSENRKPCYRIAVPDCEIEFTDGIAGKYSQNLAVECGDFILKRGDGVYAYQLAVTVDDCESGVTEVVRGADLISSTPRQIWLAELLGYAPPKFYHIPLVCDYSGRKLSKSEGDGISRLLALYPPERILGALAYAAGIIPDNGEADLKTLVSVFDWENVRCDKILLPSDFLVNTL